MDRESVADFYRNADNPDRAIKERSTPVRLFLNAAHLYRLRVREQPLQEVLALIGIAAGVALLFAVQVASTSITGSLSQLAHGVTGNATLEVAARGPDGMDQAIVAKVQRLASVRGAAPAVEKRITVDGPSGSAPLTLVGVDERLGEIGGPLARSFISKRTDIGALGFYLTSATAQRIGVTVGQELTVESGATKKGVILAGTLDANDIRALTGSPVALAPLGIAQRIAEMPRRISRVMVEPRERPGIDTERDLRKLVADRADVRPSDTEVALLGEALKADRQSSALFSAIALAIGLLFAYNAMVLSIAKRRRYVAYLRIVGADRATVLAMLVFEAIALGLMASLIGILIGDLLSRVAFQSIPEYLASGFTIGSQRIVDTTTVILSILGGGFAALVASLKPAFDLFRVGPALATTDREQSEQRPHSIWNSRTLWLGLTVVVLASALALLRPAITPVGLVGVFAGLILILGPLLTRFISSIHRVTRIRGSVSLAMAVDELAANPARATAVALIAAGAVTATLSIGGTRLDLNRGVHQLTSDFFGSSELWVSSTDRSNVFVTREFNPRQAVERIKKLPEIRSVTEAGWTFLDVGRRRLLVILPPSDNPNPLVRSQVIDGNPVGASAHIRSGGWIALSSAVTTSLGAKIGDHVNIPTATGERSFRLAAITANHGWPSGSIVMNRNDYRMAWGTAMTSALSIRLKPGFDTGTSQKDIATALGPQSALSVRTAGEMVNDRAHAFVQGLARLRQIAVLILGASILAIVAAMFAAVWQRKERIASLRAIGVYRHEIYGTLLAETGLIVLLGGLGGVVFGIYGQYFTSRWTAISTGYHTPFEPAFGLGLLTLAQIVILAAVATAGPGYLAARVTAWTGSNAN